MKKENIYIDLSKLSEDQRITIRQLLFKKREYVPYFTNLFEIDRYYKLHFDNGDWLCGDIMFNEKTELSYPEFIKLFEGGDEAKTEAPYPWIDAREEQPLCVSTGNWDGKQSDIVLAETFTGKKFLAQCYEGFMDGSKFYDWYQVDQINSNDWLITESVSRWMKIPF